MIIYLSKIIIESLFYTLIQSNGFSDIMADLSNDIRLAVDSGKIAFGINSSSDTILSSKAKMVIIASKNKGDRVNDILHLAKISEIKVQTFEGTPMALGVVCGKPFSVSVLSIIDAGNSNILNETY
jgi:large subunit ribosomal protein L30e